MKIRRPFATHRKISTADLAALQLIADHGHAPIAQVAAWRSIERNGLIRVTFGPPDTPDADRLCCYLTDFGREVLAR